MKDTEIIYVDYHLYDAVMKGKKMMDCGKPIPLVIYTIANDFGFDSQVISRLLRKKRYLIQKKY